MLSGFVAQAAMTTGAAATWAWPIAASASLRRFSPSIRATFYAYWLEKAEPRYRRAAFISLVKEEARRLELALDAAIDS